MCDGDQSIADHLQQPLAEADRARYAGALDDALGRYKSGDLPGALSAAGSAKELQPAEPAGYMIAGIFLYAAGRSGDAAGEFKRSIELARNPQLRAWLAGRIRDVTEQPRSDEEKALLRAAFGATEAKHPAEALPPLRRALDLNALNARTRYEIGFALIDLGRVDDAIPQLEEARKINPTSAPVLHELQFCYSERKRYGELRGVVADRVLVEGEQPATSERTSRTGARTWTPSSRRRARRASRPPTASTSIS